MRGQFVESLLLLGLLSTATTICLGLNKVNSQVRCIENERQALLKFKQGLQDNHNLLSSWGSHEEECCIWKGIECSNQTGHVVTLDLRQTSFSEPLEFLSGKINSSIVDLQHLTYLDLSCNNFSILPEFIGSLAKLQYLNLSYNLMVGNIQPKLKNLSSLISLDLSWNNWLIEDHNLEWVLHLSSLKYLDLSSVNLSKVVNWMDKVNMLPSLLHLSLSECGLSTSVHPALSNVNSSSPLSFLDLSFNHLNSSVFPWLYRYTNSLVVLHLSRNKLEGHIPQTLGNMVALVDLKLSFNIFVGIMPQTLENLHNLQVLDLSYNNISGEVIDLTKFSLLRELCLSNNRLNGSLTKSLAELSMLQVLDVSSNCLQGDITESHLPNLSNLYELDFSYNSVSLKVRPDWVPPFHLDTIRLRSCKLGPAFPRWLQTQNLKWLDISDAGISNTIPNWFWDFYLGFLNLSRNNITGTIPPQWFLSRFAGFQVDLSYNRFSGLLPQLNFQ